MKKIPLHVKILLGMLLGVLWGLLAITNGWVDFTIDWVKPFGTIFINLLKLVAVPLVIVTIIDGITSLSGLSQLTRIGTKTIKWFFILTIISTIIGLFFSLAIDPGKYMPIEKRDELKALYAKDVSGRMEAASQIKDTGPLQILEDMVPSNFFFAAQNNSLMLQIIFFSILFGIGMAIATKEKVAGLKSVISAINEIIINMVRLIMIYAPIGVFALIAGLIVELAGENPADAISLLKTLTIFAVTVITAIAVLMGVVYPIIISKFTNYTVVDFMKKMVPAQIVAFSTSSSAATLPVTFECAEKNLKISSEVCGFVLPLGITINMNGTAIHQVVSAIFIAHAFGHDLTFGQYVIVILTSTISSMGAPAVPGSGIIMLLIVLGAIGVEPEGLALILAIDRPLDMLRTIPNIVGDAIVAAIVDKSEGMRKVV
jgi:proton glutamate symport protein